MNWDAIIASLLEEDLLAEMLRPAPVPAFAAETVRPGRSS